ncbi:hypothetical protein ACYULU_07555 [Breznakiellaceae bacterium SP9]
MNKIKVGKWESSFEKDYRDYLNSRETADNARYRSEGETIFEALSSKEADFTFDQEGKNILKFIQEME